MSSFNENMLSSLFDYQRFENDHVLQALIDETEKSYGGEISDDELGEAVADYMAMFDAAMKEYFAHLPDTQIAAMAAEDSYRSSLSKQRVII